MAKRKGQRTNNDLQNKHIKLQTVLSVMMSDLLITNNPKKIHKINVANNPKNKIIKCSIKFKLMFISRIVSLYYLLNVLQEIRIK